MLSARRVVGFLALSAALFVNTGRAHVGRFPGTVSAESQPGDPSVIVVESTFGLLVSRDGGEHFDWICEEASGYGNAHDPVMAVTGSGGVFVTSLEGLVVSHDAGCEWLAVEHDGLTGKWVHDIFVDGQDELWAVTSGTFPNSVLVTDDEGATFDAVGPDGALHVWRSVRVAPSDQMRVYLTGILFDDPDPNVGRPVTYRSPDRGATWEPLGFGLSTPAPSQDPGQLILLGVLPTDPDVVFARLEVRKDDTDNTSMLLRSADGGASWDEVLRSDYDRMADWPLYGFHAFSDGQRILVGSPTARGHVSEDAGLTFTALPEDQAPHLGCVTTGPDGSLVACGANWVPDFMALARSTDDGATWTKTFRFVELRGVLECPVESVTNRVCEPLWPALAQQFGIGASSDGAPDAGDGGNGMGGEPGGGCGCGVAWGVAMIGLWPSRRRRKRKLTD